VAEHAHSARLEASRRLGKDKEACVRPQAQQDKKGEKDYPKEKGASDFRGVIEWK